MWVDGQTHKQDWLSASDLVGGGTGRSTTVNIAIFNTPDTGVGKRPRGRAPSYPSGPPAFPAGVVAAAVTTAPTVRQPTRS
jgi:hypothetical protein